jgi:predicted HAD superfamily Cof-like phosphohydrolase
MIKKLVKSVRRFHEAAGIHHPYIPSIVEMSRRELRVELLNEEFNEYLRAEHKADVVEIADALGDMMYVIVGTALEYGIDLDKVIAEICRSNLSKVTDGEVKRRDDGKILKPEAYSPPDITGVLGLSPNR